MHQSLVCLSMAAAVSAITLHPPRGPYGVSITAKELVDTSRKDPYAARLGLDEPRRLMVSVFEPIGASSLCENATQQYMLPATAATYDCMYDSYGLPSGTFGSSELSACNNTNTSVHSTDNASVPIAIFSPGLGNSRLIYSGIAQSLASQGYGVITVDHPYDAAIVEYPDGSYVLAANISSTEQITFDLSVRVKDLSFVLDNARSLFASNTEQFDFDRFVAYGHSLGGATAVATMSADHRIVGAINLDGSLWGPVITEGIHCPVLFFAHQGKNLTTDPSWMETWDNTVNTTKIELQLLKSAEGSFTDFPLLADAVVGGIPEALYGLIGAVPGKTVDGILNDYMGQFFEFALRQTSQPVPKGGKRRSRQVKVLKEVVKGRCATKSGLQTYGLESVVA